MDQVASRDDQAGRRGKVAQLDISEIHAELLKLLVQFHEVCETHGLRYSMDAGTLLGAVRHKGFIPWDDDMDVIMPRSDYEQLISLNKDNLPNNIDIVTNRINNGFIYPFAKFCNREIYAHEPLLEGKFDESLWIDVFPMDGLPGDPEERERQFQRAEYMRRRAVLTYLPAGTRKSALHLMLKRLAGVYYRLTTSPQKAYADLERTAQTYPFEGSPYCADLVFVESGVRACLPATDFDNRIMLPFEGRDFWAVPSWDAYLTGLYGDYMQLPPENERHTHGTVAFRRKDAASGVHASAATER